MHMLPVAKETKLESKFEIDFILCTRNRASNILELLRSIDNLDGCHRAEVTVVDSSDNPMKLSYREFSRIGKINLLHSLPGLPTQRNIGLEATSNPIIVFLDDDVLLESNFITATLSEFESNVALGGLGYLLKGVNFSPRQIFKGLSVTVNRKYHGQVTKSGKNYWYPEIGDHSKTKPPMWLPGCAMGFRRTQIDGLHFNPVLEEGLLGGYALGEDVDFSLKVHKTGKSFGLCTSTLVNHYEAPGERDNSLELARAQGHWLRYLTKTHKIYVYRSWVFFSLFMEFFYLFFAKYIRRGSASARMCSKQRLVNFLTSSPYSEFN